MPNARRTTAARGWLGFGIRHPSFAIRSLLQTISLYDDSLRPDHFPVDSHFDEIRAGGKRGGAKAAAAAAAAATTTLRGRLCQRRGRLLPRLLTATPAASPLLRRRRRGPRAILTAP